MWRIVIGLVVMVGLAVYVRQQFRSVVREVATPRARGLPAGTGTGATGTTATGTTATGTTAESRIKCVVCRGSGRAVWAGGSRGGSAGSQACESCRGLGWVDNPMYGFQRRGVAGAERKR